MFVSLIDRILRVEPWKEIRAIKNLSFRENYLRDHFPGFPIMPGALQLEAMIHAAQWLLRKSLDFPKADFHACSVMNTRYSKYVRPGDQVVLTVTITKNDGHVFGFRGMCECSGEKVAAAHFELVRYEAAWQEGIEADRTSDLIRQQREIFERLTRSVAPSYGVEASRKALPNAPTSNEQGKM
jgi:3-hydroxyacyl-[acyl-carrier-protein] dehydratase